MNDIKKFETRIYNLSLRLKEEDLEPEEKKRIQKQIENYRIYIKRGELNQRPPTIKKDKNGTNLTEKPERTNKIDKHLLSPKRLSKLRKMGAV